MKALPLVSLLIGLASLRGADAPLVQLIPQKDRIRVEIGGQLFTNYIFSDGASRSYCYPILAPDGTPLTRNFPMKPVAGEDTDHPWQRSLWFAHSMVNGVDFWNEGTGDSARSPSQKGHTVVDGEIAIDGPRLRVKDRWLSPAGELVCTDDRTVEFGADSGGRTIDFSLTLHALPGRPLLMGDNKDGVMAVRLAQWMTMPHKIKGVETGGRGRIVTSTGKTDAGAWGQRADWCEYHAEHNGKTYGVAIFDDPNNLRHPTWWMARDYGLFGANPFGRHDYENLKSQPHIGDYAIAAGGSLTLHYRFYFHLGDERAAGVAEHYAAFAAH
jgi:hypothetical protein